MFKIREPVFIISIAYFYRHFISLLRWFSKTIVLILAWNLCKTLLCTIRHFDLERSEREKSLSNKEWDSSLFCEEFRMTSFAKVSGCLNSIFVIAKFASANCGNLLDAIETVLFKLPCLKLWEIATPCVRKARNDGGVVVGQSPSVVALFSGSLKNHYCHCETA